MASSRIATPAHPHKTNMPQDCTRCVDGVFYSAADRRWLHATTLKIRCTPTPK